MIIDNYKIYWQHTTAGTICIILDQTNTKLYSASTKLHEGDRLDREIGRKLSLQRVLKGRFDRELRMKIWEAYRTMTKVPRWGVKKKKSKDGLPHSL